MPFPWLAAATALSVGASLYGASSQRAQANANAEQARQAAVQNAISVRRVGKANAQSVLQSAFMNSLLSTSMTGVETNAIMQTAEWNALMRYTLGKYNADVIRAETDLILEESELDQFLTEQVAQESIGAMRAGYANAGVMINEGTPVDVAIDIETKKNFRNFITRHNADVMVRKMFHEAAISEWQGEMEAASIMFNARVQSGVSKARNTLTNFGNIFNALQQRSNILTEANEQFRTILAGGSWQESQYRSQGNIAFMDGIFKAGTAAAWGGYKGAFDSLLAPTMYLA